MTVQEVRDTVNSRVKQKQNDIYALSSLIRVAVLSCFVEECRFPDPPQEYSDDTEQEGDWKKSYNYMAALSKIHKGGAKN